MKMMMRMMRMMIGSFIDTFIFIILDVLKSDPNSHFMMLVLIKVMRIEICSMCLSIRLSKSNCYDLRQLYLGLKDDLPHIN